MMKQIFIFGMMLLLSFGTTFADNSVINLDPIDNNFRAECYEYYKTIPASTFNAQEVYKIQLNKTSDIVVTQNGYILPYKYFLQEGSNYLYSSQILSDVDGLSDNNPNSFIEISSNIQNQVVLSLNEILEKGTFKFVFKYKTDNYKPRFFIGDDLTQLSEIKTDNIDDFSFEYLKIVFVPTTTDALLENIKIEELYFSQTGNTIIVQPEFVENIEIYSHFSCLNKDVSPSFRNQQVFQIDANTKTIEGKLEKNPKYNLYKKNDLDSDGVDDDQDNCKNIYNPKQTDSNSDGRGDMCSDDDSDGVIGHKDNCIYMKNFDQKDINRNGIGDICEFDKDRDGVFDVQDNCINQSNPDQADIDSDGIGNICDNSIYYNPRQIDKNNNGIGDITEQKEKKIGENDDDTDGVINDSDNCKAIANTDQADTDGDGIGDACDNCKAIQNTDQLDFLQNGIGDICEDSDSDGIEGLLDNCIHFANPDQKDDDNDGIGNICEDSDRDAILLRDDNCPYDYNPDQKDIDNDGLGDVCDLEDNRFIESNKGFFIAMMLILVTVFGSAIFMMVKKLK